MEVSKVPALFLGGVNGGGFGGDLVFRLEPIWWIGLLCLELMFVVLVEAQGEGTEGH
jgi:hypothetical protein